MSFFQSETSFVGVDIGINGIKVVELQKKDNKPTLVNYGFSEDVNFKGEDWANDPIKIAGIINKIFEDSGIVNKNVVSALPTFAVFSSIINIPEVPKSDIDYTIEWEAKKVIPLPIEDMILDWKKIENTENAIKKGSNYLLTGAPKTLVKKQLDIFRETGLNLLSLETETFSLIRALLGNNKSAVILIEIGAGTTDVSLIENTIPVFSRSIDVGGDTISKTISQHLNIGIERAEQFKYDLGIVSMESDDNVVPKLIIDSLAAVVNEIKYVISMYQNRYNKKAEKIVLSGGSALLPGLAGYLSKILDMNVVIGDPWSFVVCPDDLRPILNEIGPRMSVAVGLALRNFK